MWICKIVWTIYTTNELQIPTVNTRTNQRLNPENTTPLFSDHPFGVAKTTGTPTTKAKDTAINANNAIWRIDVIKKLYSCNARSKKF